MNTLSSRLLAATAILATGVAIATPAAAQRVERVVAFGDSYIDDGNVFELTGTPVPPIYPLGRFSNGTNLVDTLARLINAPILNYGIGGAVARAQNTALPQVQAFDLQTQSFLAGGGPPAFPRSSGRFAPTDLLIVNIGANDARAYERQFGVNPTAAQIAALQAGVQAQAQLAAGEAIRNLNGLVAAGARNLTVLGGDVGFLPEVRGLPVAAVGSAYSTAYNNLLKNQLAAYAAQGAIVNYLDLNLIAQQVQNNLGAFGIQSTGACPIACVTTNPELLDRFLFYVDQVHLTQRGYEIVGQYAARQLEAPLHMEAQVETVLNLADGFANGLQARLDLGSPGGAPEGLRLFGTADYGQSDQDESLASFGHRFERWGTTFGAEYHGGAWLIGAAINYVEGDTEIRSQTGGIESEGLQGGVFGGWSNGNAFVEGFAGIGKVELEIRRDAVIDEIQASPDADTLVAGIQAGYLFDVGALKAGPIVGLNYARAQLEGYTETGDPVLTLTVSDQEDDELVGNIGVEFEGEFDVGGGTVSPYLIVTAERELESEARTVRYASTAAPNIVNSYTVGGEEEDTYGRIFGGADFEITRAISLQVAGGTTIGQDGGDNSAASVGLRIGF